MDDLPAYQSFRDATFVVVDTETTGAKADTQRVIEIAAVKVRGGEVIGAFTQLINPERAVPHRITELTGISTAMVFDQPTAPRVLPRFLDFLGDGVFVAHNLHFDLGFLNAELRRLRLPDLPNPTLCTLRLARRLLPGLRSKGLSSLADFYGIRNPARHRAYGDAHATAQVLLHFFQILETAHDVETLEDLLRFQHLKYSDVLKPPKHVERIRREILPGLPGRPGVYFMKDRRGAILYIGKAKSLRDRVRSYFTGLEGQPQRTRQLVETLRDVEWTETGSELGALLLESRLIKAHQPRFNRAQRRYRNRPFLRLGTTHEAPALSWSSYVQDDGAEYFGPLGGRRQAELIVEVVNRLFQLRECDDETYRLGRRCLYAAFGRCTAPCEGGDLRDAYPAEVQRVRDFLTGRDRSVLASVEEEMKAAAGRLAFEEAAEYRDWLRRLERMLGKQQQIAAPVLDHHAVIVQPGVELDTAQAYLVRFGRLAEVVPLTQPPTDADVERLRERLAHHFDPTAERPARYLRQEVDEVRLLAHWLYTHRTRTHSIRWSPEQPIDDLLAAVLDQLAQPMPEDVVAEEEDD